MKSDLDAIMQANQIDALLVTGPGQHNPALVYLTGGGHLTSADLIKKRGKKAVLFHGPMERDEAAKSGLLTRSYSQYPYRQLMAEAGGDRVKAAALRYQKMLKDAGVTSGKVALFGVSDLSTAFPIFSELQRLMPEIQLVGDPEGKIIPAAVLTKDEVEIERIRRMGKITVDVVGKTADYLTSQQVKDGVLYDVEGQPLTIGSVKEKINLWLAERGAENPEGTIFAIGADAGVPHSSGNPTDLIRLGQTIVFDIFPCEAGGGYYYDFTRTWCLGYAPDEVQKAYEQVLSVFDQVFSEMHAGVQFSEYQKITCSLFEEMGHPTVQTTPETEEGYVHSIGHGLGLRVHERPFSGVSSPPEDRLIAGTVVTIEPGLYYPSRGFGIRLEDTVWVRPDGKIERIVEYPLDLVLPMKNA